ncbi:MAG TPA: major capsid protein [Rhizomicrobium sp.]
MTTVLTPTQTGPIVFPFSNTELTEAINLLPTPFGQITAEGYFPAEGMSSQYVRIDIVNGVLTALPATGNGAPSLARHDTEKQLVFTIPKIKHQDDVLADDIKGWMALAARAGNKGPETMASVMNRRLQRLKNRFNLTWELMRMSALKGIIVDGAGTVLYDLFAAFEITQKVVYFDLSNASSDIQKQCDLVYTLITQDLSDDVMTLPKAKVSRNFFNALISHANVQKFYTNYAEAQKLANVARGTDGGYKPRSFEFGGILFEEYSAVVPMWGGANTPIIESNTGYAFPMGTMDTHATYVAPPDDIRNLDGSDANIADAIHITTEAMKHGAGIEMLGQSHILPLWRRPKLLVKLLAGSGSSTAAADGE